MKLLEKLKNTFFEEEYVEVEADEDRPEPVAKKVEVREIKKEEKPQVKVEEKPVINFNIDVEEEEVLEEKPVKPPVTYSDRELVKKNNKMPYFEEADFVSQKPKSEIKEEKPRKIYGEEIDRVHNSIYVENVKHNQPYEAPIKGAFQPTPIISPIYGVLDKNYRKEEVIDKKDRPSSYVSRRNADLDSIRKKAYGDISIMGDEKPPVEEEIKEDPLLYDMMVDDTKPVVDQVTMADAEEYFADLGLEYNVDYKDARYENATGRRVARNSKVEEIVKTDEDEDANLDGNLFDLVDSVYEDGE